MPTSNERKMLSSNEALKELKQVQLELVVRQSLAINKVAAAVTRGCRETTNDL